MLVFVAAYLFREWVIQNTCSNQQNTADQVNDENAIIPNNDTAQTQPEETQQYQQQQQSTARSNGDTNESPLDEKEQIAFRLEELRKELERRRKLIDTQSDTYCTNQPLSRSMSCNSIEHSEITESTSSGFHLNLNRPIVSAEINDDESDDDALYTSGAQSPFVSWRDYQQGLENTSRSLPNTSHERDIPQSSLASKTWRATDFSTHAERLDYFNRNIQTNSDQEAADTEAQHDELIQNNNDNQDDVNNGERPFDIVEDIDGVLEAIGIRGNPFILLKNSVLMYLMINLCLCITIWIPYVIGRSLILFQLSHLVHILRFLLDPVVNALPNDAFFTFVQSVKPSFLKYIQSSCVAFDRTDVHTLNSIERMVHYFCLKSAFVINAVKRYRTPVGQLFLALLKRWRECALRKRGVDRIVCTLFGYILLITLGSWYLSKSKRSRPGSTNEILRQQGVFLKVLVCIFLELVLFPTVCGILIDISTLPLFAGCSFQGRLDFLVKNPYSGIFLHWFVGTGFVFQYSTFVVLVREVIRPGVLWFINNPNDPQFHPVQEMAERPILSSIKKMCTSAIIYFILLMIGMGLATLLISKYSGIYPVLWSFK